MTSPKSPQSSVFKHQFFYDGLYRVTTYLNSAKVCICKKKGDRWSTAATVDNTSDNYRAAVKRVHRMYARDLLAKNVSTRFHAAALEAEDTPPASAEPKISSPLVKAAIQNRRDFLNSIQTSLLNSGQATFTIETNVEGLTRTYLIQSSVKKVMGTVKVIPKATLSIVLPYKSSPLVSISEFEGAGCVNKAIIYARHDAQNLRAVEFLLMLRTSVDDKSSLHEETYTVYIGREEATVHMRSAFFRHTQKFFQKVQPIKTT